MLVRINIDRLKFRKLCLLWRYREIIRRYREITDITDNLSNGLHIRLRSSLPLTPAKLTPVDSLNFFTS